MENLKFNLPEDPDLKKVAAASLTAAVCNLMENKGPAQLVMSDVHIIYETILGLRTLRGDKPIDE